MTDQPMYDHIAANSVLDGKPMSGVARASQHLNDAINTLRDKIDELEVRIAPVVQPADTQPGSSDAALKQVTPISAVASTIHSQADALDREIGRLRDLIDRVDL